MSIEQRQKASAIRPQSERERETQRDTDREKGGQPSCNGAHFILPPVLACSLAPVTLAGLVELWVTIVIIVAGRRETATVTVTVTTTTMTMTMMIFLRFPPREIAASLRAARRSG